MSYKVVKTQPKPRSSRAAAEEPAPGLYPGEVLVDLGPGRFAALSVDTAWQQLGGGVAFMGAARWCDASGQTQTTPEGVDVHTTFSWTADPVTVATYGAGDLAPLKREVLLILMGEPPELMLGMTPPDENPPVINISQTVRQSSSIVHAIESVGAAAASPHPKDIL